MAVQNPFFGRREPEPFQPRTGGAVPGGLGNAVPGSPLASALAAATTPTQALANPSDEGSNSSGGSKLTVGPNIKLKGVEITDCDTLVVEGTVEATMDSRVIQIAEQGAFRGSADIDIAEIRGEFNGTLNVREKLVIFSTGRVTGKIRYGKLVVEEGGQLSGEIEMGVGKGHAPRASAASPSASARSSSSAAEAAGGTAASSTSSAPGATVSA
ncbi:MAG: polymer-forming cytoskeletal protein [Giesbergeria sp.]|nr:polymer-forming cytoskeletal protein [Giesbergeria sp.]